MRPLGPRNRREERFFSPPKCRRRHNTNSLSLCEPGWWSDPRSPGEEEGEVAPSPEPNFPFHHCHNKGYNIPLPQQGIQHPNWRLATQERWRIASISLKRVRRVQRHTNPEGYALNSRSPRFRTQLRPGLRNRSSQGPKSMSTSASVPRPVARTIGGSQKHASRTGRKARRCQAWRGRDIFRNPCETP